MSSLDRLIHSLSLVSFFQPQLSSAQNGSAVTSDPASGSGSLGSGPLLESEDHQAMSNKPRFISVNSLEDVQVRQQHPLGFFLLVFFRSGLKLLKGYQMWGGGGGGEGSLLLDPTFIVESMLLR